ncbi:MAG TPA: phage holin family protein [Beijerinckiaceae bacterium]|nr:phage holin family protein [Beijerinckiaceae bacterium]
MKDLLGRLFASTIGAAIDHVVRRLARTLVFVLVAGLFFVGLLVFLILAGYSWLRTYFPPDQTALIAAGVMLVLGLLSILPLAFGRRRPKPVPPAAERLAEEVAPIVQLLKAAGLQAEASSMQAAAQLAGKVRPIYLVAAAVLVGAALGRKRGPSSSKEE